MWKGQQYPSYPIQADGFELSGQGASNLPKLTVSNVMGLVTGLAEKHNQLVGAVVTRRQTYAQFLDAANFQAARNPKADPTQEIVSKFTIEQLSNLNAETATFTLAIGSRWRDCASTDYVGECVRLAVSGRGMWLRRSPCS